MQKHGEKDKMGKREKHTYTEGAKVSVGKHTDIKREKNTSNFLSEKFTYAGKQLS